MLVSGGYFPLLGVRPALGRLLADDGHGLVADDIKQALIEKGLYTEAQLEELDPKQIIMKIFEPGFSTTTEADRDSGRDRSPGQPPQFGRPDALAKRL